jgi:NADH-quinone oxidoreductase subunit D/NADH-quinone oxidoreductase subunit C/D
MSVNIKTLSDLITPPQGAESPLSTQEYFINMGPQHPATHGVLRLLLRLDGENVREVIPVLGYIHRGIEKIGENSGYRQLIHLVDRLDYLSALMNNWAVSRVVEKAAGIETNDRIETIRTLMAELQRIQSHALWWGVMGMDLGAFTPFLYGFRDREYITDIFEETIGARLTMNYIQPGGLMFDIHPNFVKRVKEFLTYFKPKLDEYEELVSGNAIIQKRLTNVGILSKEDAVSLGATGPVLRASGVPYDLRKLEPYGVYDKVEFDVVVGQVGDCWDRYWVRVQEMRESIKIVEQLIDNIPEGDFMTMKVAKPIKPPAGRYYGQMETARGMIGVFVVSEGAAKPYRFHVRTPNFNNLWCLCRIAPGWKIADLVAMISSLDIVVPDIDR